MPQNKHDVFLSRHSKENLSIKDCTNDFKLISSTALGSLDKMKSNFIAIKNEQITSFIDSNHQDLGKVGYGVCYKQEFQFDFTDFRSLDYCITIPQQLGGNVNDFLYLTASNSCAKGCEAYLSYYGQDEPLFCVYDWSIPEEDKWVVMIPYQVLEDYRFPKTVTQWTQDFIRVLNQTTLVSGDTWENKVYLFNNSNNRWDLLHNRQFFVTNEQELKVIDLGFWGPIIETQQTNFTTLNPIGFADTMLFNNFNTPDPDALLNDQNTFIRTDNNVMGIDLLFVEPNHTFFVS